MIENPFQKTNDTNFILSVNTWERGLMTRCQMIQVQLKADQVRFCFSKIRHISDQHCDDCCPFHKMCVCVSVWFSGWMVDCTNLLSTWIKFFPLWMSTTQEALFVTRQGKKAGLVGYDFLSDIFCCPTIHNFFDQITILKVEKGAVSVSSWPISSIPEFERQTLIKKICCCRLYALPWVTHARTPFKKMFRAKEKVIRLHYLK